MRYAVALWLIVAAWLLGWWMGQVQDLAFDRVDFIGIPGIPGLTLGALAWSSPALAIGAALWTVASRVRGHAA